LGDLPSVGAIRGRGLLAGIELVEDVSSDTPFPRSAHFAETLTRTALDARLIVWPNIGHRNGADGAGDLIMLAPPFTVTTEEIDTIVERLGDAITQTVKHLSVRT
jgi:adenosylmethionine-8-amino-7-oxononanoate aminotransferase